MNHPFTCMVVGPTKAGKTMFVKRLIENKERMIDKELTKFYGSTEKTSLCIQV